MLQHYKNKSSYMRTNKREGKISRNMEFNVKVSLYKKYYQIL